MTKTAAATATQPTRRPRRRPETGSIVARADGSFEARLWVQPPPGQDGPGKRVSRRARTRREAEAALAELRERAARPREAAVLRAANRQTLSGILPGWEASLAGEVADGRIRARHAADLVRRVRQYLVPAWGGRQLSTLRPSDVAAVSARMHAEGLSTNTRRHVILSIRRLLAFAALEGLVAEWIPPAIKLPPQQHSGVRPTPSPEQVKALLARLHEDLGRRPGALLALLALGTGARRGETCAARVADVAGGVWTVRASAVWTKGVLSVDAPKNGEQRSIPLPGFVLAALDAERRRRPFRTHLAEHDDAPGRPVHPDCLSAYFRKVAAEVGVPGGLHSLRRYVGTEVLNPTADLDATAALLGHRDVQVLRRFYVADRGQRVAAGLAAVFGA